MSGISWTANDRATLAQLADYLKRKNGLDRAPNKTKVVRWALRLARRRAFGQKREGR